MMHVFGPASYRHVWQLWSQRHETPVLVNFPMHSTILVWVTVSVVIGMVAAVVVVVMMRVVVVVEVIAAIVVAAVVIVVMVVVVAVVVMVGVAVVVFVVLVVVLLVVVIVIVVAVLVVVVGVEVVVVVVIVVVRFEVRHARNSRKYRLNDAVFFRFLSNGPCAPSSLYSTHTILFKGSLECANPLHAHVLRHSFAHMNWSATSSTLSRCSTPLVRRKRPFVFSLGS